MIEYDPCPTCGRLDCEGAPRYKGICQQSTNRAELLRQKLRESIAPKPTPSYHPTRTKPHFQPAARNAEPDAFEQEILDIVLKELRKAMKMKGQLSLVLDPYVDGSGIHIFSSPNTLGASYVVEKKR